MSRDLCADRRTQVYDSLWFERLVRCIGLEATRKLITMYGGKTITLPRPLVFFKDQRNVSITKDWLSGRYRKKDLQAKWGLSQKTISAIIKETLNDPNLKHWLE